MSTSKHLIAVLGIEVPVTDLLAPSKRSWTCAEYHIQSATPKFCVECGGRCEWREASTRTPLLLAWAAREGVNLDDCTTEVGSIDEARPRKGGPGLYVVGPHRETRAPLCLVLGVAVPTTWDNEERKVAHGYDPEASMAMARDYCASFGVLGNVKLYVATWETC